MAVFFLILIALVPLSDLLAFGLPITHDGQDHVARIANFYQNLSDGNVVPRWAVNLNWGYGHPILMFLYPLPSYLASLFHFFGFSLVDSTKLVLGVTYILSGIGMYLWTNEFLGKKPAIVSSALYLFAPYRFIDLYVRGAIGEHVAFVFPPLILYFLLKLTKRFSWWFILGGSVSLAGLILSHNAISLMFLPIIILYTIYLLWISGWKILLAKSFLVVAALGFGLSAFFWMPAFLEGKYTLRDIVTSADYASRFVHFQDLLYGQWDFGGTGHFSVQVGIVQLVIVILTLPLCLLLYRRKNIYWMLLLGTFVIFVASILLMLPISGILWHKISILQKFQFPWRFLTITVFTTALLGGFILTTIPKRLQFVSSLVLIFALFFFNKDYWHAKDYLLKPESFFTGIYSGTTDTGESSPLWSVRFMEHEPIGHVEVLSGSADVEEIRRTTTIHVYKVDVTEKVRIRENTLYFPGWEVFVDNQKANIEFQDPANRGLITFFADKGRHDISIRFSDTKVRTLANAITITCLIVMVLLGLVLWKAKKI